MLRHNSYEYLKNISLQKHYIIVRENVKCDDQYNGAETVFYSKCDNLEKQTNNCTIISAGVKEYNSMKTKTSTKSNISDIIILTKTNNFERLRTIFVRQ